MEKYNSSLAEEFIIQNFEVFPAENRAKFHYSFDKHNFTEELIWHLPAGKNITKVPESAFFALHITLGLSYYKLAVAPKITVKSGALNSEQKNFWQTAYKKGLGEMFFQNQIDFRDLINFFAEGETKNELDNQPKSGNLLCLGGGKDSLVAAEILLQNQIDFTPLIFGNNQIAREQTKKLHKAPIIIERKLDPKIFELNQTGKYYNGHVPFSFILAFSTLVAAIATGAKSIIVANESSANCGNTEFLGMEINHQWSKTIEAEKLISGYIKQFVSSEVDYFSLLRPFNELKIAEIFVKNGEFFQDFASCNANFKQKNALKEQKWCNNCPKCAFVFALFSTFLNREQLKTIFGENLFEKESLRQVFKDLYEENNLKPFECVGEKREVQAALESAIQQEQPTEKEIVLQDFRQANKPKIDLQKLLDERGEANLPLEFSKIINEN